MDEVMKWGPFLIKFHLVSILISGLLGYFLLKYHLKQMTEVQRGRILDTIGNSIFLGFVVWKLSLIFLNPISVINHPIHLLYFSGGYRGWMIALIFVFAYVIYQSKKQNEPLWRYYQLYGLGFSTMNLVYHVIFVAIDQVDLVFHLSQIFFSALFIWWFFKGYSAHSIFQGMVWLGILQIFVLFFTDRHTVIWLGLSKDQLIFLVVSLIGFFGSWIQQRWLNFNES